MKKLLTIILSLFMVLQLQAQNEAKRFTVKSGKIVYNLTGNTTGTKTVFFDDFGDKYYEHVKSVSETRIFGSVNRSEMDKITIYNKSRFWTIDNLDKKNYEGELPFYSFNKAVFSDMTEAEQKQFADDMLKSFGGQREGTEKILNRTCEKISVMGSFSWIYKGIVLKSETNVMGVVANETATTFTEDISIPDSKFAAPAGVTFINIDKQQAEMFGDFPMGEMPDDDYNEDYYASVPVNYSFEKFKKVIADFTPEGFARTMVMNQEGQHVAMYNQGYTNIVSVVATSMENAEEDDETDQFETFQHKGKTMRYGEMLNDGVVGHILIITYKQYNMYIILLSVPGKSKETMLDWSDKLDF